MWTPLAGVAMVGSESLVSTPVTALGCNFYWPVRLVRRRSRPSADNELFGGRAARKRSSVVRRDSIFFAIVPLGSAPVGAALENPPTPGLGVRGGSLVGVSIR